MEVELLQCIPAVTDLQACHLPRS